ncbi:MAG: GNAT family N-acetyltransferase [Acidimicrobiia bacterium]|nr:GNAT family N-acetyltransferase [Acidimicrobiia bacterium]
MGSPSNPNHDESGFARLETADGLEVLVRLGTVDDEKLLVEGFEQLSDLSRYNRFFAATPHLSRSTVDHLLDVGADHVVLVALTRDDRGGSRFPAGGIRAVWLDDEPGTAELAVTVIDAYQGRGLGTLLTAALAAVVAEQGITTLSAEVLAVNEPMLGVLRSFGAVLQRHPDNANVITARLDTGVASARLPHQERTDLLTATTRAERTRSTATEPS